MKKFFINGCLSLILGASYNVNVHAEPLDNIVAVVNDGVITRLELETELVKIRRNIQQQNGRVPSEDRLRKQVLDRMVLLQIQLQRAESRRIRVDDESINRAINNIAQQNNLELPQLREALEADGNTYNEFRNSIRDQMIVAKLQRREVDNTITITEQEVENYLKTRTLRGDSSIEYKIQHILISVPEAATSEQIQRSKRKIEAVLARLKQGEDFVALAIAESDGQQALNGGDLGWRKADAIPTVFVDAVLGMETGEISPVIRSPSGYHLIRVKETRSSQKTRLLQETKARHILIAIEPTLDENVALENIQKIRQRLESGEDFATLAKAQSDDKGSGEQGGDLGWTRPGQMVKPFELAMNSLAVGVVSEPIRTQFGWHLIEVQERREVDNTESYEKNKTRDIIRMRKLEPALDNWRRRLRDEAFVQIK
ncbi:MAG: peptidylprolyl isomerase [Thiohalomonadales bacterium]